MTPAVKPVSVLVKVPAACPSVDLASARVGIVDVELQHTPEAVIVAPPFEEIVPPLLAPYLEIVETTLVADSVGIKIVGAW